MIIITHLALHVCPYKALEMTNRHTRVLSTSGRESMSGWNVNRIFNMSVHLHECMCDSKVCNTDWSRQRTRVQTWCKIMYNIRRQSVGHLCVIIGKKIGNHFSQKRNLSHQNFLTFPDFSPKGVFSFFCAPFKKFEIAIFIGNFLKFINICPFKFFLTCAKLIESRRENTSLVKNKSVIILVGRNWSKKPNMWVENKGY